MKTIEEIESETAPLRKRLDEIARNGTQFSHEKEVNTLSKKIRHFKVAIEYLKTKPSESFIKSEAIRLNELITILTGIRYQEWLVNTPKVILDNMKDPAKEWDKKNEISKKKGQLKMMKYILGE